MPEIKIWMPLSRLEEYMHIAARILGAITVIAFYWWTYNMAKKDKRPIRINVVRDLFFTLLYWYGAAWLWDKLFSLFE